MQWLQVVSFVGVSAVPPVRVLVHVVGDAVGERDAVRHMRHERVPAAVAHDGSHDLRSARAVSAHVEVQTVPSQHARGRHLRVGRRPARPDVADGGVGDRLRGRRPDEDVRPAAPRSLDANAPRQVERLLGEHAPIRPVDGRQVARGAHGASLERRERGGVAARERRGQDLDRTASMSGPRRCGSTRLSDRPGCRACRCPSPTGPRRAAGRRPLRRRTSTHRSPRSGACASRRGSASSPGCPARPGCPGARGWCRGSGRNAASGRAGPGTRRASSFRAPASRRPHRSARPGRTRDARVNA